MRRLAALWATQTSRFAALTQIVAYRQTRQLVGAHDRDLPLRSHARRRDGRWERKAALARTSSSSHHDRLVEIVATRRRLHDNVIGASLNLDRGGKREYLSTVDAASSAGASREFDRSGRVIERRLNVSGRASV